MSNNHSKRQEVLDHLNQIIDIQTRIVGADFDITGFMNLVVDQMQSLTPATGVVVELVEGDDMVYRAACGTVKNSVGLHLPRKNSISGLCVEQKEVLRSDDTENDPRVNLEACRRVKARSMVVAPLFHDGNAVGVLKILSNKPNEFSQKDVETLQLMANMIGSALAHQIAYSETKKILDKRTEALQELKKTEEKLKHIATHDTLTGLPNRAFLMERLVDVVEQVKRTNSLSAILFLDIDHFKQVNDTMGHGVGDELLKAFSLRIKHCIREADMAARLGGDEFVILLGEIPNKEKATKIAEKIITAMSEPFVLQQNKINVGTSIGVRIFNDGSIDSHELMDQADKALYVAKQAGRNNYKIFE
jgi:diguanylate cyclase (GGDEF)-like protein